MKIYHHIFLSPLLLLAFCVITLHAQPGRWAEPVNISNNAGGSTSPDMAIGPDGKIHVVWEDYTRLGSLWWKDILYACYDGIEWSEPEQVSAMDTTYSLDPFVAVDSLGRPHVVWNHRAIFPDADAYYSYKTDTGWTEPLNLAPHGSTQYDPDICIDSRGFIHVVWSDFISGNGDIYYQYYDGVAWSDYVNISNSTIDSGTPHIVVDSEDNLHVVWWEGDIFYSRYDGIEWSPVVNISQNTLNSINQSIALDSNDNPHVVWRQSLGGYYTEIYYTYFNGEEWMEPEDITNVGLRSGYPSIDINSRNVKCIVFIVDSQTGYPYINYSFYMNSHWTYPDSIFDEYTAVSTSISVDDNDIFHVAASSGIVTYNDIVYTYFQPANVINDFSRNTISENISLTTYPNPFNISNTINYSVPDESEVNLSIYNINGQLVKTLMNGLISQGNYYTQWNGTDRYGIEVSGGVYFIGLKTNNHSQFIKIILLK